MQGLRGGEDAMLRLDQMEALYYKLQLQLYDIQAEVLQCEELLLTTQLQSLRKQITGGRVLPMFCSDMITRAALPCTCCGSPCSLILENQL